MSEADNARRSEELKTKVMEAKQIAFEEEIRRIDGEVEIRAKELAQKQMQVDLQAHQEKMKAAEQKRRQQEEAIQSQLKEVVRQLGEERKKKEEERRRLDEERKRKEAEERRLQEEEAQKKADEERRRLEEEARRKAEEGSRKIEEEERKKAEKERRQLEEEKRRRKEEETHQQENERKRNEAEEKRKKEEEHRLLEEEIHRIEAERRKQEEERLARIRSLIANAEVYFENQEYDKASVEIAKALVNDPTNPEALAIEQKIKDIQVKEKEPDVEEPEKEPISSPVKPVEVTPRKKSISKSVIILAGIAAVIVAVIVIFHLRKTAFHKTVSFAVMPWTSSSTIPEEMILGSSLAEEVACQFTHFNETAIMGFESAYSLSQVSNGAVQMPFQLGYQYVLTGTVKRVGDELSVEVKIIDSVGSAVWSHQYQKEMAQLADLPTEIARNVIEALDITVPGGSSVLNSYHSSSNANAYLFYLRGKEMLRRRTPESLQNAHLLFQEAIREDGNFAEALAAASSAMVTMWEHQWSTDDSTLVCAKQFAERSIKANSSLGVGHCALGKVFALMKQYQNALQEFETAASLLPNSSATYLHKGELFLEVGKISDAMGALSRAYVLNPIDPDVLQTFAYAHQLSGTPLEGFLYHQRALLFVPDSTEYLVGPLADAILFDPELSLSQYGRIGAACERRLMANPNDYVSMYRLARLLQVMGKDSEAVTLLNKLSALLRQEIQQHPKNSDAIMYLALTLTRLGNFSEAVMLAKSVSEPSKENVDIKYLIAQMYSIQMYSQEKKKIDEKKKEAALSSLREAATIRYKLDKLTSADFYNLRQQPEFSLSIRQVLR